MRVKTIRSVVMKSTLGTVQLHLVAKPNYKILALWLRLDIRQLAVSTVDYPYLAKGFCLWSFHKSQNPQFAEALSSGLRFDYRFSFESSSLNTHCIGTCVIRSVFGNSATLRVGSPFCFVFCGQN